MSEPLRQKTVSVIILLQLQVEAAHARMKARLEINF